MSLRAALHALKFFSSSSFFFLTGAHHRSSSFFFSSCFPPSLCRLSCNADQDLIGFCCFLVFFSTDLRTSFFFLSPHIASLTCVNCCRTVGSPHRIRNVDSCALTTSSRKAYCCLSFSFLFFSFWFPRLPSFFFHFSFWFHLCVFVCVCVSFIFCISCFFFRLALAASLALYFISFFFFFRSAVTSTLLVCLTEFFALVFVVVVFFVL